MLCSTAGVFLGKHPLLSLTTVIKAVANDTGCMSLNADELREEMSSISESVLAALLLYKLARVTAEDCAVYNPAGGQQRLWGTEGSSLPGQPGRSASCWGYLWCQGMKQAPDLLSLVRY